MKKILIVDDEQSFLLSLIDMFQEQKEQFTIITALNGKKAIAILDKEPVDLVVTDLKMPEMDGFALLAHMSKATPEVPVIVMTAFGTPEMEDQILELGAFQYIEKPIEFNVLLSKIREGLKAGSKGHVAGISVGSFLQLLELERKTCTLSVTAEGKTGTLFFKQGDLLDAEADGINGLEAAFTILCWDHAEIDILNMCRKRQKVIEVPLGYVLIEAARKKDEVDHPPADADREAGETAPAPKGADGELDLGGLDFDTSGGSPPSTPDAPAPVPEGLAAPLKGMEDLPDAWEDLEQDLLAMEDTEPLVADESKPATMEIMQQPAGLDEAKTPAQFMDLVSAMAGIQKVVGIGRDGTPLANSRRAEDVALLDYVGQVAVTAQAIARELDFNGLERVILGQKSGDKLAVLVNPAFTLGLEIAAGMTPADILDKILPDLNRMAVQQGPT
ncbi:MAG: hypothetical protein AUK28_00615 [Desulfobacterales bacterium CG2_30_60_27]|nr:MAG: hypothetical protein AUK28_00615 [Desulfobacterales bacterium CG2_30_60_27]